MEAIEHLGDGAYVGDDGYHLWLGANSHENMTVALEEPVVAALLSYIGRRRPHVAKAFCRRFNSTQ